MADNSQAMLASFLAQGEGSATTSRKDGTTPMLCILLPNVTEGESAWIAQCPKKELPADRAQWSRAQVQRDGLQRWFRYDLIRSGARLPNGSVLIYATKEDFSVRGMLDATGALRDDGGASALVSAVRATSDAAKAFMADLQAKAPKAFATLQSYLDATKAPEAPKAPETAPEAPKAPETAPEAPKAPEVPPQSHKANK